MNTSSTVQEQEDNNSINSNNESFTLSPKEQGRFELQFG